MTLPYISSLGSKTNGNQLFVVVFSFRLILTPILIEGEEQRNNSGILLRLSISIPRADLKEVLKDASVPLLEFYRESVNSR